MENLLKQSTAVTISLGPFVDDADGKTAEGGVSLTVYLSKNGGAMATRNSATSIVHDSLGYYRVPLDATDTNTVGLIRVMASPSGALPVWRDFLIVPANVFDALMGTDKLQVHNTEQDSAINTAITSSVWAAATRSLTSAVTVSAFSGAPITAAALATDAVNEIRDGVWAAATKDVSSVASPVTVGAMNTNVMTAAALATDAATEIRDAILGATIPASYGASTVGYLLGTNLNATISSRSSHSAADVKTAMEAGGSHLALIKADTDAYLDAAISSRSSHDAAAVRTALEAAGTHLTLIKATIDSNLDAPVSGATSLTSTEVAQAVLNATAASYNTASTIGQLINRLDAAVSSRSTLDATGAAVAVWDAVATSYNDVNSMGALVNNIAGVSTHSANDVRDAILNVAKSGYNTAGTVGEAINRLDAAISTRATPAQVATEVAGRIETYRLDELLYTALGTAPTPGSVYGELTEDDGGVIRFNSNALELAPTGSGASAATIAAEVWNSTATSFNTAGTMGNKVNSAASAGDPWTTTVPGSYTSGQAGYVIDQILDVVNVLPSAAAITTAVEAGDLATILATLTSGGTVYTNITGIKAKTDLIPASPAAVSNIPTAAQIRSEIDSNSTQLAAIVQGVNDIESYQTAGGAIYDNLIAVKAKTDLIPAAPAATGDIPTAASIATQVLGTAVPGAFGAGTLGKVVGDYINHSLSALNTAVSGVNTAVGSNATAISTVEGKVDTAITNIATVDGKVTALPVPLTSGQTETAVSNSLAAIRLDELMASTAAAPAANSVFADLLEDDGGVFRFTANSLELAPTGGGASISAIADEVWNRAGASHVIAGSMGKLLNDTANITIDNAAVATAVWATLAANNNAAGSMGELLNDTAGLTVSVDYDQVADSVWNALEADHAVASSMAMKVKGLDTLTQTEVAQAVWNAPDSLYTATATMGKKLTGINPLTTAETRIAVWQASYSTYGTIAGTYGKFLDHSISGSIDPQAGSGSVTFEYEVTSSVGGAPIEDVVVSVSLDLAGTQIIARARTNENGIATFFLDPGTYYLWRGKSGYSFTNPDTETIT